MKCSELTNYLSKKYVIDPIMASIWAYRVLNEYPEVLRNEFINYVAGKDIDFDVEIEGFSINRIMKGSGCDCLFALDLMNVMYHHPSKGKELYSLHIKK